mmetsp:Transcript_132306/g.329918  ORF Transcript_132306/g.329918 Transcript_132306/m.329918 type:complete len:168 (+) Transcript_132306:79-582(+)
MVLWFHQSFSANQQTAIVLAFAMLIFVAFLLVLWVTDIYRLLPGWGPVRKFDACGNEGMRIAQLQIHQHAVNTEDEALQEHIVQVQYGAIGPPTWGFCESSDKRETPINHPVYGQCKLREGFAETQRMRAECEWWGRDEPHFMAKRNLHSPQLQINEPHLVCAQRMV